MELKNIDPDDISDILIKVEKAFDFKFGKNELENIKTFGDLFDIVTAKVQGVHVDDCTTQQVFYKLRNAIATILPVDKSLIVPGMDLHQLFPRHNRMQKIRELQSVLGMPVDILDIREWLQWTVFAGVILSLIMLFFTWRLGLGGLASFMAVGWTANKFFAKELELATVGQLAQKLAREKLSKFAAGQFNYQQE